MKEALLYQKSDGNTVRCNLCAHRCLIRPGKDGICHVRENREGVLYTKVYGRTITQHVDPVEKKPLYHFFPGSKAFSIATPGCNFHCRFCQNWNIAQPDDYQLFEAGQKATPEQIVRNALGSGAKSIAYTYTEPTIFFEYSYDTAIAAHEEGLKNIYVSNGYMTGEMLDMIHPCLDAINIDLKAFRDETYKKLIGARLQPVLDNLIKISQMDIWLEVTSLIIPGVNDAPEEIGEMARFVATELGEDVPWHISRFFPSHHMSGTPPTPLKTLLKAKEAGRRAGLKYVYIGNAMNAGDMDTHCPQCEELLIERSGFGRIRNNIQNGHCPYCGTGIAGVGL